MSRFSFTREELEQVLKRVPSDLKLDLIQMMFDLVGLVNPMGDAASALISLCRGDFIGAGLSAISIIPFGDVVKIKFLAKYSQTVGKLVTMASADKKLCRAIEPFMNMLNDLLKTLPRGNEYIDFIRAKMQHYFISLNETKAVMKLRGGLEKLVRSKGKRGDRVVRKGQKVITTNPDEVADMLFEAVETGRHKSITRGSQDLLEEMGRCDQWIVTCPRHTSPTEAREHITILVEGGSRRGQYHLILNKEGHLYEIQHLEVVDKTVGGIKPWEKAGDPVRVGKKKKF